MKTWLACLLGKPSAILELASARSAFPAGLLLLLSAGLAREYDGVFLPREPWRLLLPIAVSTVMGFLLWLAFFRRGRGQPGAVRLRSFLGVFWMSAPLAWLYGIPYERFLSPLAAFQANLWTLALVSLWRVLWVARVIGVLHGGRPLPTLLRVLLCADVVVFAVASLAPQPVQNVMGGIRGSPVEHAVGDANFALMVFAVLLFPILLLFVVVTASRIGQQGLLAPGEVPGSRDLTRFARISVLAWLVLGLLGQPEQFQRWSVERDLRAGRIKEALEAMSARSPDDFPPQWDPPPHPHFSDDEPSDDSILTTLLQQPVATWVADRFMPKVFQEYAEFDSWDDMSLLRNHARRWAEHLGEEEARKRLEFIAGHAGDLTSEQRQAVDDLLSKARSGIPLYEPEEESG